VLFILTVIFNKGAGMKNKGKNAGQKERTPEEFDRMMDKIFKKDKKILEELAKH
jgi:hypothetical protein